MTFDDIDLLGTQQTVSFSLVLADGTQLEYTEIFSFENLCSDPIVQADSLGPLRLQLGESESWQVGSLFTSESSTAYPETCEIKIELAPNHEKFASLQPGEY